MWNASIATPRDITRGTVQNPSKAVVFALDLTLNPENHRLLSRILGHPARERSTRSLE
jgi:hypothetical protein